MRPNWSVLLLFIYRSDQKWEYYREKDRPMGKDHPFVEQTSLSVPEVRGALSFLERHALIEDQGEGFIQISEKGFSVARDQELREQQIKANRSIEFLTLILALTAVIELGTLPSNISPIAGIALSVVIFLLLILIWVYTRTRLEEINHILTG